MQAAELDAIPPRQLEVWSTDQCYFAAMGGITVQTGPCFEETPRLSVTPEGIRLLSLDVYPKFRRGKLRIRARLMDWERRLYAYKQCG